MEAVKDGRSASHPNSTTIPFSFWFDVQIEAEQVPRMPTIIELGREYLWRDTRHPVAASVANHFVR
jgi:hypothetical protein